MLLLLGIALPLAILGFGIDSDGDEEITTEGTEEADRLEGHEGRDFIDGFAGNDVLNGRAGDDVIFGREGEDVLQGEDGDDMLCSGDDDDIVTGNLGHDLIEGQGGDDFVSGDYGWDTVRGDEGNDTVIGGRGGDEVVGGAGDDIVFGGIINNLPLNLEELTELRDGASLADLNGGIELRDDSLGNTLIGGEGDDELIVGSFDTAEGGIGADTFHIMSEQSDTQAGATITDYNSADDALTIIVDDVDADLDITVTDEGADAVIRAGDSVLARIQGSAGQVDVSNISLVASSTAASLFDPNGAVT